MHRKTHHFPAGELVVFLLMLAMAAGLLTGLSAITSPAAANPAMFQPAVTAASQVRPVWNGYSPSRWTGQDAMCPASSARLHRWARADQAGPWFRVECLPDAPGVYVWSAITRP